MTRDQINDVADDLFTRLAAATDNISDLAEVWMEVTRKYHELFDQRCDEWDAQRKAQQLLEGVADA